MLGREHPDSLSACAHLADTAGEAGNPARARKLYAELLPAWERVFGPEHPDTLTSRDNLAHWTRQAKRGRR